MERSTADSNVTFFALIESGVDRMLEKGWGKAAADLRVRAQVAQELLCDQGTK